MFSQYRAKRITVVRRSVFSPQNTTHDRNSRFKVRSETRARGREGEETTAMPGIPDPRAPAEVDREQGNRTKLETMPVHRRTRFFLRVSRGNHAFTSLCKSRAKQGKKLNTKRASKRGKRKN